MFLKDTANLFDYLRPNVINLILLAENNEIDLEDLIKKASSKNLRLCGGIFPMILSGTATYKSGCIIKYIPSTSQPKIIKNVGQGDLSFELEELSAETKTCYVFLDGLMRNISRFLERLYEKYWNRVSYIGAGCGSIHLEQSPCIFDNTGVYQDSALVLLSNAPVNLSVKHGWEKIAGPFVANKTDENRILELNWQPAYEIYKEVVESHTHMKFAENDFFSISKGFPFGIFKEGKEHIVRDPIALGKNGELICVGNISQNVALNILKGDPKKLIDSASAAAKETINESVRDILVVDCISRILYLGDSFEQELQAANQILNGVNSQAQMEGILSIGEISSNQEGYLELYNKTIVISSTC